MALQVAVHRKRNGSVSGISKHGFSLLELMIAIAIVGMLAMVVAPNLGRKKAGQERKEFLTRLSSLTRLSWQNALVHNKLNKVAFDFKKKTVSLEQATTQKDAKEQPSFVPVKGAYLETSLVWPDYLQMKNFYIEGYDELSRFAGRDTGETWFFVVPDGQTQRVTINFVDTKDRDANDRPKKFGLVLNPFTAQFTLHDTFKK